MKREETINRLQDAKDGYKQYLTDEALDMAIKALEQESYYKDLANSYEKTINKLTKAISEQELKKDTLDKIRAEIAVLDDADYDYEGYYKAVTDALQIIDKYRKEG